MVSNFNKRMRIVLIICLLILSGSLCASGQNADENSSKAVDAKAMQKELIRIIHEAAQEARMKTADGTIVTTTPLASAEDLEKVKRFGNEAIPFLSTYIKKSKDSLEQQVAVRLIGSIGTDNALDELGVLAEQAQSPFVRSLTLGWLAPTRRDKDTLLLQRVSMSDPDPKVRAEATHLLKRKSKQ